MRRNGNMMNPARTETRRGPSAHLIKHCEEAGCPTATRNEKPYCSKHIKSHPYVTDVLSRIEQHDMESLNEEVLRQVLVAVQFNGPLTLGRLYMRVGIAKSLAKKAVRVLRKRKLVWVESSKPQAAIRSVQAYKFT